MTMTDETQTAPPTNTTKVFVSLGWTATGLLVTRLSDVPPGGAEPPIKAEPECEAPITRTLKGRINVTRLSDVKPEEVSWIWPGYIARGKLTLLIGDPGCGKSYLTAAITARLTTGKPWPDGAPGVPPADVLLLQAEDGLADTVRPRLDALGADPYRVIAIRAVAQGPDSERRSLSTRMRVCRARPVNAAGESPVQGGVGPPW